MFRINKLEKKNIDMITTKSRSHYIYQRVWLLVIIMRIVDLPLRF